MRTSSKLLHELRLRSLHRTAQQEHATESALLTVKEVARTLRVDATTVRRWVKQGALEAIVLPTADTHKRYRIQRRELDHILQS